ncbi:hypothetical protein VTO42DRAFT_8284 [Malbranchea cinnamomea]
MMGPDGGELHRAEFGTVGFGTTSRYPPLYSDLLHHGLVPGLGRDADVVVLERLLRSFRDEEYATTTEDRPRF